MEKMTVKELMNILSSYNENDVIALYTSPTGDGGSYAYLYNEKNSCDDILYATDC